MPSTTPVNVPSLATPAAGVPAVAAIIHPAAFPGLVLGIPGAVPGLIDALVGEALAGLDALQTATDSVGFGLCASRLPGGAVGASVARWGFALLSLATRLDGARRLAAWQSGEGERSRQRSASVTAFTEKLALRTANTKNGPGLCMPHLDRLLLTPSPPAPGTGLDALQARQSVYQLTSRVRHLLMSAGAPSQSAMAIAALTDGVGWSELAALLDGEGVMPASQLDRLAHEAVRLAASAWRITNDGSPVPALTAF